MTGPELDAPGLDIQPRNVRTQITDRFTEALTGAEADWQDVELHAATIGDRSVVFIGRDVCKLSLDEQEVKVVNWSMVRITSAQLRRLADVMDDIAAKAPLP